MKEEAYEAAITKDIFFNDFKINLALNNVIDLFAW